VTIVCSEKGWIRTLRGHLQDLSGLQFKEGDRGKFVLRGHTTDRLLLLSHSGKFFTLDVARLPGGRGHGEPLRLMIDIEAAEGIAALLLHRPGGRLLLAASDGNGFIAPEEECLANTRKGKQVMNVKPPAEAALAIPVPAEADHLAVIGENRKLVIFPLDQVPEMARGRGVRLQKYKEGGLSDAKAFRLADGLSWIDSSGRTWTVTTLDDWLGDRAQAGRMPPKGFPRSKRFEEMRPQRLPSLD
jgi:topoisomerase IV subunit A